MDLLALLQKTWPVLLLELLLSQDHLHILSSVVDLALLWIDLSEELNLEMVSSLEGIRVTGEVEGGWLKIELEVLFWYVWNGDGKVDVVLLLINGRRALSPKDCDMLATALQAPTKVDSLLVGLRSCRSSCGLEKHMKDRAVGKFHLPSGICVVDMIDAIVRRRCKQRNVFKKIRDNRFDSQWCWVNRKVKR